MENKIQFLPGRYDVEALQESLQRRDLWNKKDDRTKDPSSPHVNVDDIWCRYQDPKIMTELTPTTPFGSVWYDLPIKPLVKALAYDLMEDVDGTELGGVLITRVPAGKCVKYHNDKGSWHAAYYSKYIIQVQGNQYQGFGFEDEILRANSGEAYWFYNQVNHFVFNASYQDRISLIVCIRTERGPESP